MSAPEKGHHPKVKSKKDSKKRKASNSEDTTQPNKKSQKENAPKAVVIGVKPQPPPQADATSSIKFVTGNADEADDGMFVPFDIAQSAAPVTKPPKKSSAKKDLAQQKHEQWVKKVQQEKEVDLVEQAREENPAPQTADGFKMLLASDPNNSYSWCQFMAFWLFRGEASKARQVAELALQTINCRQEQDIYNVWAAYLALEDKHGTQESLHAVFRRAIQNVDQQKKLWYYVIDLMYKGEKYGRVHHMYKEMLRRFNTDVDVWAAFYRWCVKLHKEEELKQIPKNALNCLNKEQHVNMMTRFGAIDMKEGNIDRGRTIFEGLVAKFPKRGDIWNVYLDMEKIVLARGKSSEKQLRALFDRVTTLNLAPKTMQGFFIRYMEFEKEHGTEASQKSVHDKAVQYVERKCALA